MNRIPFGDQWHIPSPPPELKEQVLWAYRNHISPAKEQSWFACSMEVLLAIGVVLLVATARLVSAPAVVFPENDAARYELSRELGIGVRMPYVTRSTEALPAEQNILFPSTFILRLKE